MKSSSFALRWGWLGSLIGGTTYLTLNVLIEIHFPDHWAGSPSRFLSLSYADWSRLLWIPTLFLLMGLAGVQIHLSDFTGRLGRTGFLLAAIGLGLKILGNIIEFWLVGFLLVPFLGEFRTGSAGSQFGYAVSGYGTLPSMAGLLLVGFAALRSNLPPRWRFLPFLVGLSHVSGLFFFFANLLAIHAIVVGLSWVALGYFLLKDGSVVLDRSGSQATG